MQINDSYEKYPLLQVLSPRVALGDGPGRQVPGSPQQQRQLHHLLSGRKAVQICAVRNAVKVE